LLRIFIFVRFFWSKALAELPLNLLLPAIMLSIVYFAVGLNTVFWWKFFVLILIQITVYWTGVGYGLLMSVFIPKLEAAMAVMPMVILPMMLLSGFQVN